MAKFYEVVKGGIRQVYIVNETDTPSNIVNSISEIQAKSIVGNPAINRTVMEEAMSNLCLVSEATSEYFDEPIRIMFETTDRVFELPSKITPLKGTAVMLLAVGTTIPEFNVEEIPICSCRLPTIEELEKYLNSEGV